MTARIVIQISFKQFKRETGGERGTKECKVHNKLHFENSRISVVM